MGGWDVKATELFDLNYRFVLENCRALRRVRRYILLTLFICHIYTPQTFKKLMDVHVVLCQFYPHNWQIRGG